MALHKIEHCYNYHRPGFYYNSNPLEMIIYPFRAGLIVRRKTIMQSCSGILDFAMRRNTVFLVLFVEKHTLLDELANNHNYTGRNPATTLTPKNNNLFANRYRSHENGLKITLQRWAAKN
jgi:hypothetical protein